MFDIFVILILKIFPFRYKGEMLWHQPLCLSVVTLSIADIDMARLLLVMLLPALAAAATGESDVCNPDKMTVYKMVLHTYWTREKFPKHYPDWRPPAQWSKVYGEYLLIISRKYNFSIEKKRIAMTQNCREWKKLLGG